MYSSRKNRLIAFIILYSVLIFGVYWSDMELKKQLTELEDNMVFIELQLNALEKEINELEEEIDELNDRCDNFDNYITSLSERVSALEEVQATEDTEEQIEDEIAEGEIEMLAQLIEAEAGNQDYIGKCLVADVVLNRVDSDIFPDTIEGVIFEHYRRKCDGVDCYQFATVKYGTFEKAGWNISAESLTAARQEYESERLDDCILYFTAGGFNDYCIPAYVYGDHYFGY